MADLRERLRRLMPFGLVPLGKLVAAAASGYALYLSVAPRPLWWVAPLAFAELALVLRGRRFWPGVGYGFVFGAAFFLPLLTWIQNFLGVEFGPWPWIALSLTLAGYLALVGGLITWVARLPAAPIWMALVVVAAETARAWVPLGGFPWGRVAFSQPEGAFLPWASIGGAPLVSLAVVLTGFGLAEVLARLAHRLQVGTPSWRAIPIPAMMAVLPVALGLALWPTIGTEPQNGTRTVAAVQGNAPDTGLGMLVEGAGLRRTHIAESERLISKIKSGQVPKPDLVVWPETATDLRGADPRIDQLVKDFAAPALIGATYTLPNGQFSNALVAWDPQTGQGERYTKQQLVPFGEYVPARAIAERVTPFVNEVDERVAGDGNPPALTIADTTVGAMICYEAAYDYPARDAVLAGAELLTAPTNNAWYGRSDMTYQQLAMARLRAVEHGRAVVVSATSGVSAIVQPDGKVTTSSSLFTAESLVDQVPLRTSITVSDRLGQWLEYGLDGAALLGIFAAFTLRGRTQASRTSNGNGDENSHGRTPDEGKTDDTGATATAASRAGAGGDPDLQRTGKPVRNSDQGA